MPENIAVTGAGICGLYAALALARSGNRVVVYERDSPPPPGNAEQAFLEWQRPGAAQFRHPHAFLAVMCNLLEKNYPDLVAEFREAGARKVTFARMLPPKLRGNYIPEPGDDEIRMLMCRRATMETVMRRYVARQPGVTIINNANILGIETERSDDHLYVRGLQLRESRQAVKLVPVDLVVDASGRTGRFQSWLEKAGAVIAVEDEDADIVYYTRHYRLRAGEEEPPRTGKQGSAGDLGYLKYGVFPGDNNHFAVIICLPNHETELKAAVRDPNSFDDICRAIPGLLPWVTENRSVATTGTFGFGDIHAVYKRFVHEGKPQALDYFAVGDSAIRTNPLYGRGCSTGIIHAHLLADLLGEMTDPVERALAFDRRTQERLRPIFKAGLAEDKRGIKRAKAVLEGEAPAGTFKGWLRAEIGEAIAAASREQLHVFRGALRTFNLMEEPGAFLKDNRVRWTVMRYLFRSRKKNASARSGPSREEMLSVVEGHRRD